MKQPAQEPESSADQSMPTSAELEPQPCSLSEPYRDVGMESLPAMTKEEIGVGQKEDPFISPVLHYKILNKKPSRTERVSGGVQVCLS